MAAAAPLSLPLALHGPSVEDADQRVILYGISWERYEVTQSRFLPDLDVAELVRHLDLPSQSQAVRTYRDGLRARRQH
jgi:hypothetical protein